MRALDFEITPEAAYPVIAADAQYAYWLDSAREESSMSRVSYVGVVPHWAAVLRIENAREETNPTPWDTLDTALASVPEPDNIAELPEGLRGGYVGYFGYERAPPCTPGASDTHPGTRRKPRILSGCPPCGT